jgi:soluble lytic murein transglycosylase-like protein
MSAAVLGASATAVPAGAQAAAERMQRLQALIAQVESGPTGFAAALDAAQASPSSTASASAGAGAGEAALPGAEPSAAGYPAATSSASLGLYAPQTTGVGSYADTAATSAGVGTAASAGSTTGTGTAYAPLIEQAAARNGVDPAVLYGLIEQESGFDPGATSSAGALGLTQLMPATAAALGVTEPLDPAQSIEGGARYLSQMLRQFGGNTADALAAYNAGPGAVSQYGGVPPYPETEQYVSKVLANAAAYGSSTAVAATPAGANVGAAAAATSGTSGTLA